MTTIILLVCLVTTGTLSVVWCYKWSREKEKRAALNEELEKEKGKRIYLRNMEIGGYEKAARTASELEDAYKRIRELEDEVLEEKKRYIEAIEGQVRLAGRIRDVVRMRIED